MRPDRRCDRPGRPPRGGTENGDGYRVDRVSGLRERTAGRNVALPRMWLESRKRDERSQNSRGHYRCIRPDSQGGVDPRCVSPLRLRIASRYGQMSRVRQVGDGGSRFRYGQVAIARRIAIGTFHDFGLALRESVGVSGHTCSRPGSASSRAGSRGASGAGPRPRGPRRPQSQPNTGSCVAARTSERSGFEHGGERHRPYHAPPWHTADGQSIRVESAFGGRREGAEAGGDSTCGTRRREHALDRFTRTRRGCRGRQANRQADVVLSVQEVLENS